MKKTPRFASHHTPPPS